MNTYWEGSGKYQSWVDDVSNTIPTMYLTDNDLMNVFIIMSNLYYEIHNNGGGNLCDGVYIEEVKFVNKYLEKGTEIKKFSWERALEDLEYLEDVCNEVFESLIDKDLTFEDHGFWNECDKMLVSLKKHEGKNWVYITCGTQENVLKEMKERIACGFTEV